MARPAARSPLTSIWKFDTTCCMTGTWLSPSISQPTTSSRPAQVQVRRTQGPVPLKVSVTAAAALDCLIIAIEYWVKSDGERDLGQLLDEAFATLAR
jgi:hypothetical protein